MRIVAGIIMMGLGLAGLTAGAMAAQGGDEFGARFANKPPSALTDRPPANQAISDAEAAKIQAIEPAAGDAIILAPHNADNNKPQDAAQKPTQPDAASGAGAIKILNAQ